MSLFEAVTWIVQLLSKIPQHSLKSQGQQTLCSHMLFELSFRTPLPVKDDYNQDRTGHDASTGEGKVS